ncbi:MAG: hypothetical protein AAF957_18300 [Planctomycetota bacterium]
MSDQTDLVVQPGGSSGNLCLGGMIGRYTSSIVQSDGEGATTTTVDLGAIPRPSGPVAATAGQTWIFQLWHRDAVGGAPTSNFTSAVGVTLR